AFTRCERTSRSAQAHPGSATSPGIVAGNSTFAVHDSSVAGSQGPAAQLVLGNPTPGHPGSAGIQASDSIAVVVGSNVRGGNGGAGFGFTNCFDAPTPGGYGGDAILLLGSSSLMTLDDSFFPGAGGTGGANPCVTAASGSAGHDVRAPAGAWTAIP